MEDSMEYSRNALMDFIKLKPTDIEICDVTLRDGEQAVSRQPGLRLQSRRRSISHENWMKLVLRSSRQDFLSFQKKSLKPYAK